MIGKLLDILRKGDLHIPGIHPALVASKMAAYTGTLQVGGVTHEVYTTSKTPYQRTKNDPNAYWAVKDHNGYIRGHTLADYRDMAVTYFLDGFASRPWKYYYRKGYRVVRVQIKEVV